MKLSEHLAKKFHPSVNKRNCQGGMYGKCIFSEDIDEWITDWYKKEYERFPPIWLVSTVKYDYLAEEKENETE